MKGVRILKITLKAARVSKGLTQKDAAKLIGITVETLANYEKGKTYPDIPILKKIEDTYDVSLFFCLKITLKALLKITKKDQQKDKDAS